jgi:hypothetical protein
LYRDILVPVILYQSMYEISRQVFKVEFAKAFRAIESPIRESRSIDTDISNHNMKDNNENKEKIYYDKKENEITYEI